MKTKNKILLSVGIVLFIALVTAVTIILTNKSEINDDDNDHEIPLTNIAVVKDGKTNYKIVIPEEPSKNINFIAYEFQDFFLESTNVEIEIIKDDTLEFNEDDYYFSIGQTNIYKTSNIEASYDELGLDGLILKRMGNTVIMIGGSDNGSMYAAYEFLERTFDLRVYGEDEIHIAKVDEAYLKDFDLKIIPTFERRSVGLFPFSINETFRNRMRQDLYNDSWIYWSHSHFRILPKEIYYNEHPDWYSADGTQLSLTNDEMREEFTRVVIELIKTHPNHDYLMLGHEDINTFCDCAECEAEIALYTKSGVMMRFVNQVADDVQAYIDEHEPGRIFYLGTFGYHQTEIAPVKIENGEYVPIHPSVIPRDNVYIMVAPIRASNSVNYYDKTYNANTERVLKGWQAVAQDQMFTWVYNKVFANYFYPLNNFSTLKENYQILKEIGSRFVYHQGNKETQAASFQELKMYVQSKLMWDVNLNPEELTKDFINNYYKDAAEPFLQYFELIRMQFAIWEQELNLHAYNNGSDSLNTYKPELWTKDLLDQYQNLFNEMLDSIEHYRLTDPELFNKLDFRIRKEKMTIDFMYLDLYMDQFTYDEAEARINSFEQMAHKTGITVWREMYLTVQTEALITTLIEQWRLKLYSL